MYLPIVLRTHRICYIHFYTHNFLIDFLSEAVIKYTAYNIIFFSWYMKKKIWHYFLITLFLTQTLMTQITISWYKNLYDDISLMVEHHITLLRSNYTLRPHRRCIYAQSILYTSVVSLNMALAWNLSETELIPLIFCSHGTQLAAPAWTCIQMKHTIQDPKRNIKIQMGW